MIKRILLAAICALFLSNIQAQCPGCVPAITCAAQKPTGGLCRDNLEGMVAHSYDKDITFYMPKTISCAAIGMGGSCTTVDLKQIKIASVISPAGISNTSNKALYNILAGDTLGCVKFCGTPLVAGTHIVTINLLANITAHGTPAGDVDITDQPFPYYDTIRILADTTKSPPLGTFTYVNKGLRNNVSVLKDCDSLDLDSLKASILGDCSLATHQWSIESKGNFSGSKPATGILKFTTPDTFTIKLTTQLYNYRIRNVRVGTVTGGYTGGCGTCLAGMEELLGKPDLFITIDVAAFNNRRNCGQTSCGKFLDDDSNVFFDSLLLLVPGNKCNQTFKLGIYDEDSAPFGTTLSFPANLAASADDQLDVYNVMPSLGTITLPNGTNTRSVQVTFDTIPNGAPFTESLTYIIHPKMSAALVTASQDSACLGQPINISVNNTNHFVEWYKDTTVMAGKNSNSVALSASGNYKATLTSAFGCKTTSNTKKITFLPTPDPLIYFKKDTVYIQNYNPVFFNYDWKIDTVSIPAYKNLQKIKFDKPGFYKVVASNKYCAAESDELYYAKPISSIESIGESIFMTRISHQEFKLNALPNVPVEISIFNLLGESLHNQFSWQRESSILDVSHLNAGVYLLNIRAENALLKTMRFVK